MSTIQAPSNLSKDVVLRSHVEHERLQAATGRVLYTLQHLSEIRKRLAREFQDLSDSLRSHMSFEEEGGFMRPVVEARPHLLDQVEDLRREHGRFRRSVSSIEAQFAAEEGGGAGIEAEIVELLDQIKAHEDNETSLILDAFSCDMGTKD